MLNRARAPSSTASNRVLSNATASILQVAVLGIVLLLLYKFLFQRIGPDRMGVWSVVTAFAAIARIGELGMAGSVVRFVARSEALGDEAHSIRVTHTAVVFVAAALGIAIALAYPILQWGMPSLVSPNYVEQARGIVVLALLSAWVSGVGGVLLGALEGRSRIDLRALVVIAGAIALLVAALALVPRYGLMGVVAAQGIQAGVIVCLAGVFALSRPRRASPAEGASTSTLLRSLLGYGLSFQAIAVIGIFLDPMTKGILGRLGGLAEIAYFEMASKLVTQARGLIVAANQVVVPYIANLRELSPGRVLGVYQASWKILCFVVPPLFAALVASLPVISVLWLGAFEQEFVVFAAILTVAQAFNVLCGPAYFSNLGEGNMFWNVLAHIGMALTNCVLSLVLGRLLGAVGVVMGYGLGVMAGSALLIGAFHIRKGFHVTSLIGREDLAVGLSSAAASGVCLLAYGQVAGRLGIGLASCALAVLFALIVAVPLWRHSTRAWFWGKIHALTHAHAGR